MSKPRVGIFAGTFDPVHDGHLAFAKAALNLGLEKVMLLPEPRPRRKQGVHALEHRTAMVQLAVADEPRMGTILLEQPRFSPSETLPVLQARFPGYELALLFGDDVVSHMIDHLTSWPHIENIAQTASLVIAARRENQEELQTRLVNLKHEHGLPFRFEFVEPGHVATSSSKIRLAAKRQQTLEGLPKPVAEYIQQHKLYSTGEIIS